MLNRLNTLNAFVICLLVSVIAPCLSVTAESMKAEAKQPEPLADQWALIGEAVNEPGWDVWQYADARRRRENPPFLRAMAGKDPVRPGVAQEQ